MPLNEADTCREFVTPALQASGWTGPRLREQYYFTDGRIFGPNRRGERKRVDYPQVGIRGFGGGLFQKDAVAGTGTMYRSFHRLYPDAIVLSQVKGWEGAIAVAGPELNLWFTSPEYRTFRCKPEAAHPDYMRALLPTPWFIEKLQGLSRGQGARRQRTRPGQFLALEIPMPTRAQQETALQAFTKMRQAQDSLPAETDLAALLPSALAQVFGG